MLRLAELDPEAPRGLTERYGMDLVTLVSGSTIPGSYWGEPEAGIVGSRLYAREDTPVHSVLHELCHFVCMDAKRRQRLDTNAGGGHQEENGVCYLQVLLADYLPGVGRPRMFADMDAWGYSFRLGSARRWFECDAGDARGWLESNAIIDQDSRPTWRLRIGPALTSSREADAEAG